ncbi:MAG: biotin transporter BioY, partial [bacterium]|nr:biotin transporter BioY [bacterium]
GYIFGFIASGLVFILTEKIKSSKEIIAILLMVISLIPCYLIGTLWFYFRYGIEKSMSIWAVLMACVIPFIISDLLKIILAWFVSKKIKSVTKK